MDQDYTLRTSDAAQRLGVSVQRVKQMVYEGALPKRKVGSQWRFSESDIQTFKKKRTAKPLSAQIRVASLIRFGALKADK